MPSLERLVLAFGLGISVAGYAYWTWLGIDRGAGWTSAGAERAVVTLGATMLLAMTLRLAGILSAPDKTG